MAVCVVELSSDSENEETQKKATKKTKKKLTPEVSSEAVHSEVDNDSRSLPVRKDTELVDTASKVLSPKTRSALSVEEVRRLIKAVHFDKLRLPDLQSYARVEGLIIGGSKEVLIDRIKTHIEILEQGAKKYSRESFTVDCSGDVCMGDVVEFEQRVYDNFTPFLKNPVPAGIRIVAGRVVKESYGEKRRQHTFTIEVLRSSGYKALAPMQRLQIKGRNLYLFGVRRQIWKDEKMRLAVLHEKHERGAAAKGRRRLQKPLTEDVPPLVAIRTKRKRKHAETCRESGSVSAISHGSAVGSKKRKTIPTVIRSRKSQVSKPKQPRLVIQQPGCKGLKMKQAQRLLPKLQSNFGNSQSKSQDKESARKQVRNKDTGSKPTTKRTKTEKNREKRRRRQQRREAERLAGVKKELSEAEKKNREKMKRRQERLAAFRRKAKAEGQVKM